MDEIIALQEKLKKIAEARRLNAKIRESLKRRLQIVDAQIYSKTVSKDSLEPFYYEAPKLWGLNYFEYSKLSQLFWGRTRKNAEDHVNYNKSYKTYLTMNDKKALYLNQYRSSKQKALMITKENCSLVVFSKQHPILAPIRLKPYSVHDVIRYYIFSKLYGQTFSISSVYPNISGIVMKRLVKNLMHGRKNAPELDSLGIDREEMQNYITSVIMSLKQD